ncbi:MAG: NAD(P)-binding protein, partial [Pseudomonadota bacterium]
MAKEKIAILGGGVGGMVTALALTNEPGWDEKYDITLYQMGWRLGGKGASGRGPNGRIQEHGLHIWLGFYWNAFNAMKAAFAELQD